MVYCTVQNVRDIGGLPNESDLPSTTISAILLFACKKVNHEIFVKVEDEQLQPVVDDSTTTKFYTRFYPLGDMNDSFTVNTDSVIVVDEIRTDDDRATLTVSAVDDFIPLLFL